MTEAMIQSRAETSMTIVHHSPDSTYFCPHTCGCKPPHLGRVVISNTKNVFVHKLGGTRSTHAMNPNLHFCHSQCPAWKILNNSFLHAHGLSHEADARVKGEIYEHANVVSNELPSLSSSVPPPTHQPLLLAQRLSDMVRSLTPADYDTILCGINEAKARRPQPPGEAPLLPPTRDDGRRVIVSPRSAMHLFVPEAIPPEMIDAGTWIDDDEDKKEGKF